MFPCRAFREMLREHMEKLGAGSVRDAPADERQPLGSDSLSPQSNAETPKQATSCRGQPGNPAGRESVPLPAENPRVAHRRGFNGCPPLTQQRSGSLPSQCGGSIHLQARPLPTLLSGHPESKRVTLNRLSVTRELRFELVAAGLPQGCR